MAATVEQVFNQAMGIMDELSATGNAQTADTKEYEYRTPAIINMLISELKMLTGDTEEWMPVEGLDDYISGADTTYALGAMGYGLAANLLVDENPTAAGFYEQRYEELRTQYISRQPAVMGQTEDVYGGLFPYNEFSRW